MLFENQSTSFEQELVGYRVPLGRTKVMSDKYKYVGYNLDLLIARKGWLQKDLAKESKLSVRHISNLVTGKAKPSVKALFKISEALSIPMHQLTAAPVASSDANPTELPKSNPAPTDPSTLNKVVELAQEVAMLKQQLQNLKKSDEHIQKLRTLWGDDGLQKLLTSSKADVREALDLLAESYNPYKNSESQPKTEVSSQPEVSSKIVKSRKSAVR